MVMRITKAEARWREVRGARKSDYIATSVFDESVAVIVIEHNPMRAALAS
jgi:hypothetical protein